MKLVNNLNFDYSKLDAEAGDNPIHKDVMLQEEFWGLHRQDDRIIVDFPRYKQICEKIGIVDFIPKSITSNASLSCFMLDRVKRHDYAVNLFRDLIFELKEDWELEYKPILSKIKTPDDVYDSIRTQKLMTDHKGDDYDVVDFDAFMGSMRRERKYVDIINSLYCQFISKVCTEIDRFSLMVMVELGYKRNDYNFSSFAKFSDGLIKDKHGQKLSSLAKYYAYNLLHKINNFLKHNTKNSYDDLKKYYPNNVRSVETGTSDIEYENGMFAGDWIIIKENYIDGIFDKLISFFEDYCSKFVKENPQQADWDYDEYFINAFHQMQDPFEYWGIY